MKVSLSQPCSLAVTDEANPEEKPTFPRCCRHTPITSQNLKDHQPVHLHHHPHRRENPAESSKRSCLQEAGSVDGNYRPSVLDEYQNEQHKIYGSSCSHVSPSNSKQHFPSEDGKESARLTRFSAILPNKPSYLASTNTILDMLRSASQNRRASLLKGLEQAVQQLSKGVLLQKYCYNKFKVEMVVLTFSEDFQFMSLYQLERAEMKVYCMKDLQSILKGFKTHRIHSYLEKGYALKEKECFSLYFKERSFDFVAESAQICDDIVDKIQVLMESR